MIVGRGGERTTPARIAPPDAPTFRPRTGEPTVPTPARRSRPHRDPPRRALAAACLGVILLVTVAPAAAPRAALPAQPRPGQALSRVDEMARWIERQRMPDGGWHSKARFGLDGGLRLDWFLAGIPNADASTTALVGVTLLRTRDARGRTPYNEALADAVAYVRRKVDDSAAATLDLDPAATPVSARLGSYIDTALALLLLAEASPARTPTDAGPVGLQIEKLIHKLESNQQVQGNWEGGACNAPLLGHALAVWALESASRKGHKVDPGVLALAGKWALSKEAERADATANGKWQTKGRGLLPERLERKGTEDDEPVNHEMYAAAARLSVLAQADRSNRRLETQLLLAARTAGDADRRAEAARSLNAVKKTRAALEAAQQAVAATLTAERGAAPFMFTAEDFLACLLIADSLPPATAERWFPPTVRTLLAWQDADGGLKTDQHASCEVRGEVGDDPELCECEKYLAERIGGPMSGRMGTDFNQLREEARSGQATGRSNDPSLERPFCPANKSFCSHDRVFCTAAALAAILADTPYKAGMFKGTAARPRGAGNGNQR